MGLPGDVTRNGEAAAGAAIIADKSKAALKCSEFMAVPLLAVNLLRLKLC